MTLPRRGLGLGSLDVIYQFEQMLHFTSLGLKENHSSCTGTNPCVCLSPSGWLVPLGPRRCRGGDRNSWASGCQPLPAPAAGPVAAAAGFKPLGLVTGLVSPCPNSQVASLMCQRGCARPGVPLPSSPIAQSLLWGCVLEAPGTQAFKWWVGKLWARWQTALFPSGKQIKESAVYQGNSQKPSRSQPSRGGPGKPPTLLRLKNDTGKR